MSRRRKILVGAVLAAVLGLALLGSLVIGPALASTSSTPIVINVGDLVRVSGTHISCGVIKRSGANTMQCVAPPPLRGTYGAVMSDRRVRVVLFRSSSTAKVVFTATQRGTARACREGG